MDDASADRASRLMGRRRFLAIGAGVAAAIPRRARPPTRGGVLKHIGLEPVTFDVHATAAHQTEGVRQMDAHRVPVRRLHGLYRPEQRGERRSPAHPLDAGEELRAEELPGPRRAARGGLAG